MTVVAKSKPVTDAYLVALEAGTERPIGDAIKPKGQPELYPYGILYAGTERVEGSAVDPFEDGLHRLQLTSVGMTRASVESLRDKARTVLLDRSVPIDGHRVTWAELVVSQPVTRDDDVKPPVFHGVDIVNVFVTPVTGGS